jgi:SAM-dependent methyltransferase
MPADVRRMLAAADEHYGPPDTVIQYSAASHHRLRLIRAAELLSDTVPADAPIVDLGSATSPLRAFLTPHGRPLLGVDMHGGGNADAKTGNFIVCDITAPLPFRSGSVHGIFAGEVIEHLFDPVRFLAEAARILSPDGTIVVTTPNLAALQDRVRFTWGRHPRHADALHPYRRFHIRPLTQEGLADVLREAGLEPTAWRSTDLSWEGRRRRRGVPLPKHMFTSLSSSLVVAAQRRR